MLANVPLPNKRERRLAARKSALSHMNAITSGSGDFYLAYSGLFALWCRNNAAVPELRPLFRMEGVDAASRISITDEFKVEVRKIVEPIVQAFVIDDRPH